MRFYNDSKSTNILACQKALSGFANEHLILIAGGLDRGNEFDELVPDIVGLKKMIVLGESAEKMKAAAEKAGVTCLKAKDVADATRMAKKLPKQEIPFYLVQPMPVGICIRTLKSVEKNFCQLTVT
ncbi:hypothetical protein ACR31S_10480 [Streptococcus iniae]